MWFLHGFVSFIDSRSHFGEGSLYSRSRLLIEPLGVLAKGVGDACGQHEAEEPFIVTRKLLATNFQVLDTSRPIPRSACHSPVDASFTSLHPTQYVRMLPSISRCLVGSLRPPRVIRSSPGCDEGNRHLPKAKRQADLLPTDYTKFCGTYNIFTKTVWCPF